MTWTVLVGDVREKLAEVPDASMQCCVTSPPYWGLRDYRHDDQLGREFTPSAYVAALVAVFRDVRRALRDDGTCWLNLGDSYAGGDCFTGLKSKDMVGIPWRVAFALQRDGWYLRSDIIWAKPNPMPESVTDRPTKAHEYVFLLAKSARYYYDAAAIANVAVTAGGRGGFCGSYGGYQSTAMNRPPSGNQRPEVNALYIRPDTRNKHSVWTITTQPYPDAHFATFPEELPETCIRAGSRLGDTVLDPFAGSGTTGAVALRLGRSFVGIELNPAYALLARQRLEGAAPLFATEAQAVPAAPITRSLWDIAPEAV